MGKIENIEEALLLLEKGLSLISFEDKEKNYFVSFGDKIFVTSTNKKIALTKTEFQELFLNSVFYINEFTDTIALIDPLKDFEYYSWKNK